MPVPDGSFASKEVEDGGADITRGERDGGRGEDGARLVGEAFGSSWRGAASVRFLKKSTFRVWMESEKLDDLLGRAVVDFFHREERYGRKEVDEGVCLELCLWVGGWMVSYYYG